jgi:hypothetical protein
VHCQLRGVRGIEISTHKIMTDGNFDFNPSDFSDFVVELDKAFETRICKPPITRDLAEEFLKFAYAEELANNITIETNSRAFVVINGSFYFGDFIEALIIQKNYTVKALTISTLSMNENNVDSLAGLLKSGYVEQLNLIVSDYFYSHERGNLVEYIYEELDINNQFQFAAAGTHCKVCLILTECGKHIVIHGSANLRSSGNIEQFVIEENKQLYDFNYQYQESIFNKYKTINKSIRGGKLWQVVQEKQEMAVEVAPQEKAKAAPQKAGQKAGRKQGKKPQATHLFHTLNGR